MNTVILNISPVGALLGVLWSLLALLPILWLDAAWDMVDTHRTLPDHRRKGFWIHYAWRQIALSYYYAYDKVSYYSDYSHAEYSAAKAGNWLRSPAGRRSYDQWRASSD